MPRFRLTVYILMILTVIGCRRNDRQTSLYESFGQEVADVLERGQIDSAMMIIETHKRMALEAQDSDAFYGALTQQAIASYYGGRQTELLRELDSIDAYLALGSTHAATPLTAGQSPFFARRILHTLHLQP